jgi:hypothetical protein
LSLEKISFCITEKMTKEEAEQATIGYLAKVLDLIQVGKADCVNWTMELEGKSAKWTRITK